MKRFISSLVGMVLFLLPAWFFFTVLVPVPEYRTGSHADFSGAAGSCLTLYGGAAIGVLNRWRRGGSEHLTGRGVFRAAFWGGVIAIGVVLLGHSMSRWLLGQPLTPGNLSPLLVVFGAAFSVMVAGGAAIVWSGLHPSH